MFDFENPADLQDWRVVNDGVMGGLSRGENIRTDSGTAVFRGTLSLENNGGFSSTRTLPRPHRLDGYDGIVLRVRGDGNTYQFRLRLDSSFDGVAYRYTFQTEADTWVMVEVPFSECVPVFRGRMLSGVDPVSPGKIQQIGFLISEKQAGPFRLEVDLISAYRR
ncbi:CIA30 family protein [Desulfosediminicola ganghwensis]|uniref:CIA30 family protein n=1 Tax=Desulfosediminicola ganghwensis TaxID=2569540 RepID=UPI0010AC96A1|nr:CIA30 family protein [Desulfosediminicola ganghwensis]